MRTARRRITAMCTAIALALGLMLAVAPAASAGSNGQQVYGMSAWATRMNVCGTNQLGQTNQCGAVSSLTMPIKLNGWWWVGQVRVQFCLGWVWCAGWQYVNVPGYQPGRDYVLVWS